MYLDLDQLTAFEDEDFFTYEERPILYRGLIDDDQRTSMRIIYQMNRNKKVVERTIYTSLDLLSDIGGIQGIFMSFFGIITAACNSTYFDEHLVSRLYKYKQTSLHDD